MRKLSRRKIILLGIIIFICLITFLFFRTLSSPASGTISQAGQAKPAPALTKTAVFNGSSVNFTYSTDYTVHSLTKSAGYLDAVTLLANGSNDQITIAVISEDIANDSGVSYRRQNPDRYKETALADGLAFVSTKPSFERTVYIGHAGLVASISAVSSRSRDLTSDSQQIIQTLIWKQ